MGASRLFYPSLLIGGAMQLLSAQWLTYPSPGTPRTKDGKPDLNAPVRKTPDGKPDLSGVWLPIRTVDPTTPEDPFGVFVGPAYVSGTFIDLGTPTKGLPYQPWAAELVRARKKNNAADNPDAKCLPVSSPQLQTHPTPRQITQLPGMIVTLFEKNQMFRIIYTDGRPLPADPQPSWLGYSTARWEGDVLVVETNGFRDDTWLDQVGSPMTSAGKFVERFHRLNYGTLEIDMTFDDPKAYTRPWTVKVLHGIQPEWQLLEGFCDNEQDQKHMTVK